MDERLLFETLRLAICRACGRTLNEGTIYGIIREVFLTLSPFIKDDELLWLLVESELPGEAAMYPAGTDSYWEGHRLDAPRWRLASIHERMLAQGRSQKPAAHECLISIEEKQNQQEKEWASRFPKQGSFAQRSSENPID